MATKERNRGFVLRLTEDEYQRLKGAADTLGCSMVGLARQAVTVHVIDLMTPGQTRRVNRARRMLKSNWTAGDVA